MIETMKMTRKQVEKMTNEQLISAFWLGTFQTSEELVFICNEAEKRNLDLMSRNKH